MVIKYFYQINEEIIKDKKIFILGYDTWAKHLFLRLVVHGVQVKGFISDDIQKIGIRIFNKPVIAYKNGMERKCSICIVPQDKKIKRWTGCEFLSEDKLWKVTDGVEKFVFGEQEKRMKVY